MMVVALQRAMLLVAAAVVAAADPEKRTGMDLDVDCNADNEKGRFRKNFGSHTKPKGNIRRVSAEKMSQRAFYDNFVLLNRPVILTSLVSTKVATETSAAGGTDSLLGLAVLQHWNDDEYLREAYGNEQVSVDPITKENRSRVSKDMALKDFLDSYHQKPWYAISELPKNMAAAAQVPAVIAASPYLQLMQDVVLWLSREDSNSHLHYDNIQNLMCVIGGKKTFIMVEKRYAHHITIDVPKGDYSAVDTDQVDLNKYPGLRDVPWWRAEVEPGSCLYIPVNWFHQVRSSKRTLAINLWWTAFAFSDAEVELLNIHNDTTNTDFKSCDDTDADTSGHSKCGVGGGDDGGGSNVAGNNNNDNDRMMLSTVKFVPIEQLRYQLLRLFDEHGGPLPELVVRDCFLAEDTLESLLDRKDPDEGGCGEHGADAAEKQKEDRDTYDNGKDKNSNVNDRNDGNREGGFGLLDSNDNGVLDRDEIASAPAATLNKAFPFFEAGALYVKCRSEEGWVKANEGLVSLNPQSLNL